MNPGFLTVFILLFLLILLATGWRPWLFPGMTRRSLWLWLLGWIALQIVPVSPVLSIHTAWLNFFYISAGVYGYVRQKVKQPVMFISSSLLVSSSQFLIQEILLVYPTTVPFHPRFVFSLIFSVLAIMMWNDFFQQLAGITMALLLSHALFMYVHQDLRFADVYGMQFADEWWLSIFLTRMVSIFKQMLALDLKKEQSNQEKD